ncbi:MAG: hypothetical protein ACK4GT_21640, partial [Pararhodobacter sp.]
CHNVMHAWSPVCDSCGGFDTLTWREPDGPRSTAQASPTGTEMLPLLVGAPKASPAAVDADVPDLSDPVQPHPPGPAGHQAAPKSGRDTPNVAPGIVPRESDYDDAEPARTVTTPEVRKPAAPAKAPAPAPAAAAPEADIPDLSGAAEEAPAKATPVLILPEDAPKPAPQDDVPLSTPTPQPARPVVDEEPRMVRPDVEPPEEADWTEGKSRP